MISYFLLLDNDGRVCPSGIFVWLICKLHCLYLFACQYATVSWWLAYICLVLCGYKRIWFAETMRSSRPFSIELNHGLINHKCWQVKSHYYIFRGYNNLYLWFSIWIFFVLINFLWDALTNAWKYYALFSIRRCRFESTTNKKIKLIFILTKCKFHWTNTKQGLLTFWMRSIY